ncbi:MAG: flagellar filament capping protein FliD [Bdellovibrionales bacterium]
MAISFGGINTGLPPNLVEQLVQVERQPIKTIEAKKAKTENKLKLVTDLDTKLRGMLGTIRDLAGSGGFNDIKLLSGDASVVDGAVDPKESIKGSWSVEVIELAQKAAAISNGFPDKDKTELGVGYFKFDTLEGTKEVYLSGGNSTLEAAAKAINAAEVGMQASVIKDSRYPDAPYRLVVAGASVGGENQVSYPQLYFLDGDQDFFFEEEKSAKNGKVKVDGIEFEVTDNQIKDIIPGVTLDIKQAAPGRPINVSVKEDREVVSGKIKSFVDTANEVLSFIQGQNKLSEKSDTSSTLGGDSLLRSVEQRLRSLIQDRQYGTGGVITSLNQLGITFNRGGTLDFDQEKFTSALSKDPNDVRNFLVGDGGTVGFIPRLRNTINVLTDGAFGAVTQRKRGLENNIKQADDRIETMERQIGRREQALKRQFANLEQTMSRLKSQGSYLQSRMGGGGMGDMNFGGMSGAGGQ